MLYSNIGRGNCLVLGQNESPYCGNGNLAFFLLQGIIINCFLLMGFYKGIQEFPEECDCGNEVSCLNDGCCGNFISNISRAYR
jgi:hypothetical protein